MKDRDAIAMKKDGESFNDNNFIKKKERALELVDGLVGFLCLDPKMVLGFNKTSQ